MELLNIKYEHYRPYAYARNSASDQLFRYTKNGDSKSTWAPGLTGGRTKCILKVSHGDNIAYIVGEANCSSLDRFCYKIGRELARFRAMRIFSAFKSLENMVDNGYTETN